MAAEWASRVERDMESDCDECAICPFQREAEPAFRGTMDGLEGWNPTDLSGSGR